MKIQEVAKLTGVTVRTLHYYDEIGLLKPTTITEAGYRLYEDEALDMLQQILFFKELDFPLSQIKEIMMNPAYNKEQALKMQKELLLKKRDRLNNIIELLDRAIEGEKDMSFKEFDMSEIEQAKKEYQEEVKERWGNTEAYKENHTKTHSYDKSKWESINQESEAIFKEFAANRELPPDSEVAKALVKRWQDHITAYYYTCTKEILAGLGLMYVADERFTKNLDKYGEGTAAFMSAAIAEYCK